MQTFLDIRSHRRITLLDLPITGLLTAIIKESRTINLLFEHISDISRFFRKYKSFTSVFVNFVGKIYDHNINAIFILL